MAGHSRTIRPQHPAGVDLSTLVTALGCDAQGPHVPVRVTGVTLDSRDVRPGDLYVGMPGAKQHGAVFARQALDLGAVAIATDADGWTRISELLGEDADVIPGFVVEHPRLKLGEISARVYHTDALDVPTFGVTGTNGKTSVIYMLVQLLNQLNVVSGMSSTAERRIGDELIVSDLTSPEASELHALLARMSEVGVGAVAIEVSAQAVVRQRLDGLHFDVVAFNNFSQDHLDEFGSMEEYFAAKVALFSPDHAERGVVVVDTDWGNRLVAASQIPVTTLATEYGASADWHLAITRATLDGTSFVLSGPAGLRFRASVPMLGAFMAENAALAIIMLLEAGFSADDIERALGADGLIDAHIPGRLERVSGPDAPRFFVDYGHTPGAFDVMLDALQKLVDGRIIMLFGADGDRDASKREAMGAIAARGSDVLIICDYNPRTEDPAAIREALLRGARSVGGDRDIQEIPDPATAIRAAIALAQKDDVILYAGPGHEEFREVAGALIPFSARDEVRGALREAGYSA